jgi:hypothetical protein
MTEYKGVKYEQKADGWHIIWPSGIKTICTGKTEAELKAEIDKLAAPNG